MSNSNNPFNVNVSLHSAFAPKGNYALRVISMKCWTHDVDGSEHPLPTMGLITQIVGSPFQAKITLACPESTTGYEGFATKVAAVIKACGMEVEDFYVSPEIDPETGGILRFGEAGPATKYDRDNRHPRCPVGKIIKAAITPDFYFVRTKNDEIVDREIYNTHPRALRPMEFWRNDQLCVHTGYYSLNHVFAN